MYLKYLFANNSDFLCNYTIAILLKINIKVYMLPLSPFVPELLIYEKYNE